MQIPVDRYIKVGTINTRYWIDGTGSSIIFIHGISNSIEDWLLNFNVIAKQHRVYAVDYIGHGKTDKPLSASYHIVDIARFIKDFMDALGIKHAHLIGHSSGGAIALHLALNSPSYVDKLVLVDSAGLGHKSSLLMRLMSVPGLGELIGLVFMQVDLGKRIVIQRKFWPNSEIVPDEMIRLKYYATLWSDIKKTYFKALRSSLNFWGTKKSVYSPIIQGLSSLANPILVIWGSQDPLLPVKHAQVVKDRVPNSRVEIFNNCGHDPMVEYPQEFNELVLGFLES